MAVRSGFLFSTGLLFGDAFLGKIFSLTIPEKEEQCKFLQAARILHS